ncbi:hypothetical protein A0H81_09222 [Grifola frondosa]|uniref:Uncharacterized protein n=1 Tax=Grifola frondosa TaxID=5627 RepID=A0A1C7M1R3_GRIFR|nr:hypothetical protein A0H81_09222 [Grifola frondosa]
MGYCTGISCFYYTKQPVPDFMTMQSPFIASPRPSILGNVPTRTPSSSPSPSLPAMMQRPASPTDFPLPGTAAYLPDLVSRIRDAHPDLPLDPVILQSLLLCIVAQTRSPSTVAGGNEDSATAGRAGLNLILRTREEDIGLVLNLAALFLTTIFGLPTHKHKVAQKPHPAVPRRAHAHPPLRRVTADDPDVFLRSLFFPRTALLSRLSSVPRPRSHLSADTSRTGKIPRGLGHTPQRSLSNSTPAPNQSPESVDEEDYFFDASSLASSRRALLPGGTLGSSLRSRGSRWGPQAQRTDPLPLAAMFATPGTTAAVPDAAVTLVQGSPDSDNGGETGLTSLIMPKAVVVSGLELAGMPAQRALLQVLLERKLVIEESEDDDGMDGGTWNLPDGFIMVYVCKWDPQERPPLLRGLLDKFAMSADISLPSSARQAYGAYRMTYAPSVRSSPFLSPSSLPQPAHPLSPTSEGSSTPTPSRRNVQLPTSPLQPLPSPVISPSELAYLRTLSRPAATPGPLTRLCERAAAPQPYAVLHPSLATYLLDLFAAARHHPALDGTLLTLHAHTDADALARAFRVLGGDTVGATLVAEEASDALRPGMDGTRGKQGVWARAQGQTASSVESKGVEVHVSVEGPENGSVQTPAQEQARARAEVWDVSEVDIARVFPRVVSHRLRVRDGPEHEVLGSLVWPAVEGKETSEVLGWERKTVKEILVGILADV